MAVGFHLACGLGVPIGLVVRAADATAKAVPVSPAIPGRHRLQRMREQASAYVTARIRPEHPSISLQVCWKRIQVRSCDWQSMVLPRVHIGERQFVDRAEGYFVRPRSRSSGGRSLEQALERGTRVEESEAELLATLPQNADVTHVPPCALALDDEEVFIRVLVPRPGDEERCGRTCECTEALDRHPGGFQQARQPLADRVRLQVVERLAHGRQVLNEGDRGVENDQGPDRRVAQTRVVA